jgi:hypothetical protein
MSAKGGAFMKKVLLRLYDVPGRSQTEVYLLGILVIPSMFGGGGSHRTIVL